MNGLPDFQQPWWIWNPANASIWDRVYRDFNLLEGMAWCVFSGLVVRRWFRHQRSKWEWGYAISFLAFGITDFLESWAQSLPLLGSKGVILLALYRFRQQALSQWYPSAKIY